MKRFKSFLKHVFFIKSRFLVPLIVLSAVLLTYIFSNNIINSPIAYLSFVLSAYTLIALCCKMPKAVKKIKGRLFSNPHSRRYLTNADLRAEISLYSGLCIHLLYSAFKLISGFHYRSLWLETEAIYYIILSLIQFLLIKNHRKSTKSEWRGYRTCGCLLLLLNSAITVIVILTVFQSRGYIYSEIIIYATAAYTFYRTVISIIQIGKFRKRSYPMLSASKFINLSASLMSLFALQTAMLTQFGGNELNSKAMNLATGIFVCFSVIYIAISMIIRSSKAIREINNSQT